MSTIKNEETRLSGIATMSKQLDSEKYPSLSKIQDVIKPFNDSVLDSATKQLKSEYNAINEVNHSPCYTVTYSLHSVNSVKLYIYFFSSTWSLLCACFFMIILPLPSLPFLYYLCRLYFLTICAIITFRGDDYNVF